ncbi:hypothetical protein LIER_32733 [Lithospermum erythrorhizon]|uniref:Cytochrome P450 n=1 Tax=Lithospermum erythrorhizon TaxID=34254 RepID=A0AAV3RXT1_LITER
MFPTYFPTFFLGVGSDSQLFSWFDLIVLVTLLGWLLSLLFCRSWSPLRLSRGLAPQWPPLPLLEFEKGRNWSFVQDKVIYLEGLDTDSFDPPSGFWFLGRMISARHIKWNGSLNIYGNFEYIPGYWEWAEDVLSRCSSILKKTSLSNAVSASLCVYDCSDAFLRAFCESWCPSTNTLITPQGELSISLWDIFELGGLPVTGRLFDEVVPSAKCLSLPLDDDNCLPCSCQFLLMGYHRLVSHSSDGTVSISSLIGFWNSSLRTYVDHEAADQSSTKIAPGSICPRGSINPHFRAWDSRDRYPFVVLGVDAEWKKKFTVQLSYHAGCARLCFLLSLWVLYVQVYSKWLLLWPKGRLLA